MRRPTPNATDRPVPKRCRMTGRSRQTLSQIAAQLKRTPGEVRSYLKRLADFDLIIRDGRRYYIADPIIVLWIKFTILEREPEYSGYKNAIQRHLTRLAEQVA